MIIGVFFFKKNLILLSKLSFFSFMYSSWRGMAWRGMAFRMYVFDVLVLRTLQYYRVQVRSRVEYLLFVLVENETCMYACLFLYIYPTYPIFRHGVQYGVC